MTRHTITTEDGRTVREGDRVFNYYDYVPGVIVPGSIVENGGDLWFDVQDDDGRRHILNGQRIVSIDYATRKGWTS